MNPQQDVLVPVRLIQSQTTCKDRKSIPCVWVQLLKTVCMQQVQDTPRTPIVVPPIVMSGTSLQDRDSFFKEKKRSLYSLR
jgi:hypothetical protein